jgi:predicted transposase YbfD/YdcC
MGVPLMTSVTALLESSFVNLTDPRDEHGKKHHLLDLLLVALVATMCGANSNADIERFGKSKLDWFRKHVPLPHGIPSHDTFGRVFACLNTAQFYNAMQEWVAAFAGSLRGQQIAIDGKTLRGSYDTAQQQSPLHTMTAFATETRICLRQMSVDAKSNEIPAAQELLDYLDLTGALVTMDALHCQTKTAAKIIDKQANYLLTVKENQAKLQAAVVDQFAGYADQNNRSRKLKKLVTIDKKHGRQERREYLVAPVPKTPVFQKWPGIQTIGMVYRERIVGDQESAESVFFISSLPPQVKTLSKHLRQHWAIENQLHHVLDVTFVEDASRIRKDSAPEISSGIRRMALNILQQDTSLNDTIRGKRNRAGWDETILEQILAAFLR